MTEGRFDARLVLPALGCWFITVFGILMWPAAAIVTAVLAAIALAAGLVAHRLQVRRAYLIRSVVITCAAVCGVVAAFGCAVCIRAQAADSHRLAGYIGHKTTVGLTIRDDPRVIRSPGEPRVMIDVSVAAVGGRATPTAHATLIGSAADWIEMAPGQRVTVMVAVREPRRADLSVATLNASGPPVRVSSPPWIYRQSTTVRQRFADVSAAALPQAESGLLPAVVLGDRSGVDDEVEAAFRACGMTHLVAVSGANFAILCAAAVFLLRMLGLPRVMIMCIALAVIIGFVVLVRPSPSVVRAAVMGALGVAAVASRRRMQALPALCAAVIMLLAMWPSLSVDPGFALSVAATAGLVIAAAPVREWFQRHRCPRGCAELAAVTVVAHVVTAPLVAMISGQLSLAGFVANIAVAIVVAPITLVGMAAVLIGMVAPGVAEIFARFTGPELWWMIEVARTCSRFPFATISIHDGVVGAVMLIGWIAVGVILVLLISIAVRRRIASRTAALIVRRSAG